MLDKYESEVLFERESDGSYKNDTKQFSLQTLNIDYSIKKGTP